VPSTEGRNVHSQFTEERENVRRAAVLGYLGVLATFASVTIVPYGILPGEQLETG
jgi:arginine:ornithine antiporter / lysine permease